MASIVTRETAGGGATVNNAPLTNAQLDQNFININLELANTVSISVSENTTITSPMTWSSNTHNTFVITAQSTDLTINSDSGSPSTGKRITFRIQDNGTSKNLNWSNGTKGFRPIGISLPSVTVPNKITYIGAVYNGFDSMWDVIAVITQA